MFVRRIVFILCCSCLLAGFLNAAEKGNDKNTAAVQQSSSKIKLTLREAKKIALEKNPDLQKAKAAIEAALANVTSARSAYFPSINLNAGHVHMRDYYTNSLGNSSFSEPYNQYTAGATASILLFNGFQRRFQYLSARYNETNARESEADARRLLINAVAQAYYQVLLAQDNMRIAKDDAEFNRMLLDDAQKRYDGGVAKQSEVLNFVLRVKNAEVSYISAEKFWKVATIGLGTLLTINEDAIWENYELVYPTANVVPAEKLNELLATAHAKRPEMKMINAKIQNCRQAITAARSKWLPEISASASYDFKKPHDAHFHKETDREIYWGIQANWNIFNGFGTTAELRNAKANLKQALFEQQNTILTIDAEVREALLALNSNQVQLEKQEVVLETAKKIRDLVHQEYLGGTTTITRLNEAQTDMNNAANARSTAYIQLLNAAETLRTATAANIR